MTNYRSNVKVISGQLLKPVSPKPANPVVAPSTKAEMDKKAYLAHLDAERYMFHQYREFDEKIGDWIKFIVTVHAHLIVSYLIDVKRFTAINRTLCSRVRKTALPL